ncbi:MAG: hypothetical protein KGZ83_14995 [Sulfuricella sp.]|nr:hypothetical protein [Sulfuricella sp.]
MKFRKTLVSVFCLLVSTNLALAQDSGRASGISAASTLAVSVTAASLPVLALYVGGVMVVESVRTIGNVVEVVFKGTANASRAVVTVTAAAASGVALVAGQSVKVVAEGSGYVLYAGGKVLCHVPGKDEQTLIRSKRSS